MTEKNRERIRAFDDPHTDLKQKELPNILLARARKTKNPRKAALLVQHALAIRLETVMPVRLQNLLTLRVAQHFDFSRAGRRGIVHLILTAEEVKNGEPYEVELAGDTAKLLKLYIEKYLPVLTKGPIDWLFPGANGRAQAPVDAQRQDQGNQPARAGRSPAYARPPSSGGQAVPRRRAGRLRHAERSPGA